MKLSELVPFFPFSVHSAPRRGVLVIQVGGDLDGDAVPVLRSHIERAERLGATMELDLAAVTFVDLTGLRMLVTELRRLGDGPNGPRLRLGAVSTVIRRTAQLARMPLD